MGDARTTLFDPGAPIERTSLAWTRTALALLVGVAIVARITVAQLGLIAVVVAVVVAPIAALALVLGRRRYEAANKVLASNDPHRTLPDGRLPGLVTAVVL